MNPALTLVGALQEAGLKCRITSESSFCIEGAEYQCYSFGIGIRGEAYSLYPEVIKAAMKFLLETPGDFPEIVAWFATHTVYFHQDTDRFRNDFLMEALEA